MPMLPDPGQMDLIEQACLSMADEGTPRSAFDIVQMLMDLPDLPMHCPYHHFLIPAALLTAAQLSTGGGRAQLSPQLKKARERAGIIPGGFCGQFGACGAALGAGIFCCIWLKTDPHSKSGWAVGNELTARCLSAIATVEGPRCCKRVTYLTLQAAIPAIREMLSLDLGTVPTISCHHHDRSRDCRKEACPFYPGEETACT